MKKLSSGRPIASTTRRRIMKPSNATFSNGTVSGMLARVAYVPTTLAVFGLMAQGLLQVEPDGGVLREVAATVLTHRHQAVFVHGQQHAEAVGRRYDVVVHQPDPVVALLVGGLHTQVEPARPAEVLRRCGSPGRSAPSRTARVRSVLALSTTITASGAAVQRGEPLEHPLQQVGAVVGDDHDRRALGGHRRYLSCPVKSPRSPSYIARALIGIRRGCGLVNR